ncbi:flagellar protein FlaG [Sulfuricurvum sp.]|uniref:flagellar protein FlaG n=1 Tax=Sulfuricurvum sp. TaxID=2025608 RepID=UPI0035683CD7
MEILQATARMQQSQISTPASAAPSVQSVQQIQQTQINQDKAAQVDTEQKSSKVGSQEQMDQLIKHLNLSLDPFNTSLKFGFDNSSKDFYVSVIDTKTNHMLRRFPLEQAQMLLPKIQEVNGLLFDKKG